MHGIPKVTTMTMAPAPVTTTSLKSSGNQQPSSVVVRRAAVVIGEITSSAHMTLQETWLVNVPKTSLLEQRITSIASA